MTTTTNETNLPGARREGESIAAWEARVWRLGLVPACGGTERPMTLRGRRVLYCVDLAAGEHAYVDLDTDTVVEVL
jgi:predicted nicotinamide N-methyase